MGLRVANYIAGGDGLDYRSDLGTINLSNMPTVMVELGNMRNPSDARRMTSRAGRATYARGAGARRTPLPGLIGPSAGVAPRLAGARPVGAHACLHAAPFVGAPAPSSGRVREDPRALVVPAGS